MVRSKGSWSHPTFETPAATKTARATESKQRLEECRANAACFKSRGSVSQSRPNILVRVDGEGARGSRESISRAQLPTEADILDRGPANNTRGHLVRAHVGIQSCHQLAGLTETPRSLGNLVLGRWPLRTVSSQCAASYPCPGTLCSSSPPILLGTLPAASRYA
jgi:hypothetical protein